MGMVGGYTGGGGHGAPIRCLSLHTAARWGIRAVVADNGSSTKWIIIGCAGLGLVGLCCIGGGGFAYYRYMEAEEESLRMVREMERRAAEEEAARQRAEEEEMRRMQEAAELEQMLRFPPPLSISPRRTRDHNTRSIVARVTHAQGAAQATAGDECRFDVTVENRDDEIGYWCRAKVECAGQRLYGVDEPRRNGFFPCEITRRPEGVAGEDRNTSSEGGDAAFQIDTRVRRMYVIDDDQSMVGGAFRIEAAITSVD